MTFDKIRLTAKCLLLSGFVALGHASLAAGVYDPVINPEDFTTKIDNPFFSMPVGKKMIYEARTEDGSSGSRSRSRVRRVGSWGSRR